MKKISDKPFEGTAEQEKLLLDAIKESKVNGEGTMSVLQRAQDIYGYLPFEVQKIVAEQLGVSMSEVYGIATFYTQFALSPKSKYQIGMCMGTACYVKGGGEILDELKKQLGIEVDESTADDKFSLEATRCLGACGLAPVMTINGDVYGKLVKKDIADILKKYE